MKQLPSVAAIPQTDSPDHLQPLLESIRQWLMEVALIGFTRLDTATLTPFSDGIQVSQQCQKNLERNCDDDINRKKLYLMRDQDL